MYLSPSVWLGWLSWGAINGFLLNIYSYSHWPSEGQFLCNLYIHAEYQQNTILIVSVLWPWYAGEPNCTVSSLQTETLTESATAWTYLCESHSNGHLSHTIPSLSLCSFSNSGCWIHGRRFRQEVGNLDCNSQHFSPSGLGEFNSVRKATSCPIPFHAIKRQQLAGGIQLQTCQSTKTTA